MERTYRARRRGLTFLLVFVGVYLWLAAVLAIAASNYRDKDGFTAVGR